MLQVSVLKHRFFPFQDFGIDGFRKTGKPIPNNDKPKTKNPETEVLAPIEEKTECL
jgi:hypothetical protein